MSVPVEGWTSRWNALLDAVRVVQTEEEAQELLRSLLASGNSKIVAFVNAHAMNSMIGDTVFSEALLSADVVLRDGSGMSVLYRWLEREPGLNMNGTDFIPQLLTAYKGRRVALWGTQEPFLSRAATGCIERYGVEIVSCRHGFEAESEYVKLLHETKPELVVLGMGMPKQERLALQLRTASVSGTTVVCGGAIIDFLGGKVSRAPLWMRRLGIEWLYRLMIEPRRLFKRYVVGNPIFIWRSWRISRP